MRSNDQIPARMLNEYAYCPRLFHLEHVQSEWAHNADTLDGRFTHRRVDRPEGPMPAAPTIAAPCASSPGETARAGDDADPSAGTEPARDADDPSARYGALPPELRARARSISVGSERLGAIAVIDLLELDNGSVTPVDYKRGSAPGVAEGAWEPERVQVCLQGLLLRDNGYACDAGVLYFAESQTKVDVPFTDELVARTLELLEAARLAACEPVAPTPLVDSPKCPRCSLVGICLPDETNLLRTPADHGEPPGDERPIALPSTATADGRMPRRLVPARDDRLPLYVQGQGFSIGLKGDVVEIRDRGKRVDEARLMDLSQVSLYGNVQLSAQALREIVARDIVIAHFSYGGWLSAVTTPPPHKNVELRRRQFAAAGDPEACLPLARAFVVGKIRNARTLLRRNAPGMDGHVLVQLASARRAAERAGSLESLLGVEGSAARVYFQALPHTFKVGPDGTPAFTFTERNRRPPRDPFNALLSFLYALLVKDCVAALVGVGFDPYMGFYHQPRYGRPALALDLMEEFRPLVADSTAVNLVNNGELRRTDFVARAGAVSLSPAGRKRVIEAYERRVDRLVTHPIFGYAIGYRRVLEVQARLLARVLTGEIERYPAFVTR